MYIYIYIHIKCIYSICRIHLATAFSRALGATIATLSLLTSCEIAPAATRH